MFARVPLLPFLLVLLVALACVPVLILLAVRALVGLSALHLPHIISVTQGQPSSFIYHGLHLPRRRCPHGRPRPLRPRISVQGTHRRDRWQCVGWRAR